MLDVFVSRLAFLSLKFSGWKLLALLLPEECVPSTETVQLYHRSKVRAALSSIVRKRTQTQGHKQMKTHLPHLCGCFS